MTPVVPARSTRFRGSEASTRSRHLAGFAALAMIGAAAVVGLWSTPVALLAAGAGAGYSLSGSV